MLARNSPHLSEPADLLDAFICGVVHFFLCGEPANTKPVGRTNTRTHTHFEVTSELELQITVRVRLLTCTNATSTNNVF